MADAPNTVSTLNGLFKEVYGDDIAQVIPDGVKVQKHIPFVSKEKQNGNSFHQPVLLAYDSGFTHAAASSGAFTLNDATAGVMKDATVVGSQILLRAQMDYEAAARAAKGRNAFVDATQLLFESMQKAMRKRLEAQLMYGAVGLGAIGSIASDVITFATADWAPGLWAGSEGMLIDIYASDLTTRRGSASVAITAVNLDERKITIASTPAMTAANDVVFFAGANANEMSGIHKILTNTGTLFGISAATYSLWKSSSYAAGSAALTQAKVGAAVAQAVAKGLDDDCMLIVNPKTWNNLLGDQAALVRHTGKDVKAVVNNGSKSIELFSQNGKITIEPSLYCREGFAYGLSKDSWKRLGACDVTMKTPGYGDQIFFHLPTKAGFEVRSYTNQAVFCEAPGKNFLVTGIVNS